MKAGPTALHIYNYNPYEKPKAREKENHQRQQCNENSNLIGAFSRKVEPARTSQLARKVGILKAGPANDIIIPPCEVKTLRPWLVSMPKAMYFSTEAKLHDEILAFQHWASPTPHEVEIRRLTVDCIHMIIKRRLGDVETQVFGSCATSLALPTSDIDIAISTEEIWTEIDMKLVMSQLAVLLKVVGLTKHVVQIPSAKVPILKFTTLPEYGSFGIDISINNAKGLQAVKAVNDYLDKMPALKPLVLVIKALLAKYGLNNPSTGGLGSYAVTCMFIFFIKTNPSRRPSSFYDSPLTSASLGTLLSDFLWYYSSDFPYSISHISAKEGCLYPNMAYRSGIEYDNLRCMSIQCLLDPEVNVAKSVKKKTLQKLVNIFQKGFADLVQASVQDKSILGQLFEIEERVLEYRDHVRAVMESGALKALSSKLQTSQHAGKQFGLPLAQSTPKTGRDIAARVEAIISKYQTDHSSPLASRQRPLPPRKTDTQNRTKLAATRAAEHYLSSQYPYLGVSRKRFGPPDERI